MFYDPPEKDIIRKFISLVTFISFDINSTTKTDIKQENFKKKREDFSSKNWNIAQTTRMSKRCLKDVIKMSFKHVYLKTS